MKQINLLNILTLIVITTGCNPNAETVKISKSEQTEIAMIIEPANIKPSLVGKAKLILTNRSADSVKVGESFFITFYNGTTWERVSNFDDMLFNDVAYLIPPGDVKELSINLQPKPFKYKAGKYKISKVVEILPGHAEAVITAAFFVK